MRGISFVLGFVAFAAAHELHAESTSRLWVDVDATRETLGPTNSVKRAARPDADLPVAVKRAVDHFETMTFLGFSQDGETTAAFDVTVTEFTGARLVAHYEVVRIVSTATEDVARTFRAGKTSSAPEWQQARDGWEAYRARHGFFARKLDVSKSAFRVAVDTGDHVTAEATKHHITIKAATGSGLGMTPVVRLYDGRREWLDHMRVDGAPGRTLTAEIETFHSSTGMHIAVLVHYSSKTAAADSATDVGRVFAMPGDPIGTTEIGAINMTAASEVIGERRFDELNPGFEEPFKKLGRD